MHSFNWYRRYTIDLNISHYDDISSSDNNSHLVVTDPNNPSQIIQNYEFLNIHHTLIDKNTPSTFLTGNKMNVSFTIPLQSQLGGTFHDRKGSVKYYLERFLFLFIVCDIYLLFTFFTFF